MRVFNITPIVKELLKSIAGLVVIFIIGYGIYYAYNIYLDLGPEYNRVYYVVACPEYRTSECFSVEGGYLPEYCEEGECRDPQLFDIYYKDGSNVSFDCSYNKTSEDFTCQDAESNLWKIKYNKYEDIKIKGWGFK